MIIDLSKDEVRVCTQFAIERWLMKWDAIDRPNYAEGKANGRLEHEVLASIRANVCEYAASKLYNVAWSVPWYPNESHIARARLPDIGNRGEVRSVRTSDAIAFWQKDLDKVLVATKCLDDATFSQVYVFGHLDPEPYAVDDYWDDSIRGWRIPLELFSFDDSTP